MAALAAVPRELFLPPSLRDLAYENRPLAIGWGQTCSQPEMLAAVLSAALPLRGRSALEAGAGCGYLAALLVAAGAGPVVAVELIASLAELARQNLARAGVEGVEVRCGDGRLGAPDRAPFGVVVVSAAAERIPPALLDQVADEGVLVAPVGGPDHQRLVRWRRSRGSWARADLGACRFVALQG